MDLRQLEMFQAIVDTGSFTRAGEKLFVSQSAVSRQIKLLESEIGDQVFRRLHRRIYLTPTGEIVLRYCRRILKEINQLSSEISDLTHLRRGVLRLAGGMSVCTYVFPPLLKLYRQHHPHIDLLISSGTNDEILRSLRANEADLALLSLPFSDDDLATLPALTEELVLVMEKDHPLASRREVRFRDLEGHHFIHFERGSNTRRLVDRILREEGIRLKSAMELQNVEITKHLVENGLGLSLVPLPALAGRGGLCYRRFEKRRIYRQMGWVWLKSDYQSNAEKRLLALFEQMRQDFQPPDPDPSSIA